QYWLGDETGISHTFTDLSVTNGQNYYYAITAYDFGVESPYDSLRIYPSENAIAVTRTARGGTILPKNVVSVRPNPRVLGWRTALADTAAHVHVVNENLIRDHHEFRVVLSAPSPDSIRATEYALIDVTADSTCFEHG